ncbi:MAG: CPBP family intramembrane glutamic endopeptidase [Bacillota bacterium]
MRNRRFRINAFWHVLCTSALIVATGVTALLSFVHSPASIGMLAEEYVDREVYSFDELTLHGLFITTRIVKGHMVPTYRSGEVCGLVITGSGSLRVDLLSPHGDAPARLLGYSRLEDTFSVAYIPVDYQRFQETKDLALARRVDIPELVQSAHELVASRSATRPGVRLLGVERVFANRERAGTAEFHTARHGKLTYGEGREIILSVAAPEPLSVVFPSPAQGETPFRSGIAARSVPLVTLLIYLVVIGCLLALVYILTVDGQLVEGRLAGQASARASMLAVSLGLLALGVLQERLRLFPAVAEAGRVAAALSVIIWAWQNRVSANSLGFTTANLWRGLLAASLASLGAVIGVTLAFPWGLRFVQLTEVAQAAFRAFVLAGLAHEILFRGLFQRYLAQEGLRPIWAIAAASFLPGLLVTLPKLVVGQGLGWLLLAEALVLIPANAGLAGYIFHRTGNIWASSCYLGLVGLLPQLFKF